MAVSIKGLLNDSQIALEKQASDKFGAAVEGFAKGVLGKSGPSASNTPVDNRNDGSWYASSYAAALAGTSDFRPKLKFLFKVEFVFTQAVQSILTAAGLKENEFTYMVKQVDRPKITFEYEEGVNMYNFRTKVLKNIQHRELTMIFTDDTGNRVFDFLRVMMMIHSPITQRAIARDGTMANPTPSDTSYNNANSMLFSQLSESTFVKTKANTQDNAHRGVVNSSFGNAIECIRIKQVFVNPTKDKTDNAVEMVSYDFINPRITNFDFDDLSHESNDVNLLTMVFDYDWMEMVKIGTLGTPETPNDKQQTMRANNIHGAPTDLTSTTIRGGTNSVPAGGNKGLTGALGSIVDRQLKTLSKDLVSKAVKSVAGNGRFANIIAQQAAGAFGGAGDALLNGAINGAAGLLDKVVVARVAANNNNRSIASDSVVSGSAPMNMTTSALDVSNDYADGI